MNNSQIHCLQVLVEIAVDWTSVNQPMQLVPLCLVGNLLQARIPGQVKPNLCISASQPSLAWLQSSLQGWRGSSQGGA